jgi:hypothetical protein
MRRPPSDPADHAEEFARAWADVLDRYCAERMEELGIPPEMIGAGDPDFGVRWAAFMPHDRQGGGMTTGITVNSGDFNPELLKGKKGGRIWPRARLRDRIDAILAHEYAEGRLGDHAAALKAAARTDLPVSAGARRILGAMARRRPPNPLW